MVLLIDTAKRVQGSLTTSNVHANNIRIHMSYINEYISRKLEPQHSHCSMSSSKWKTLRQHLSFLVQINIVDRYLSWEKIYRVLPGNSSKANLSNKIIIPTYFIHHSFWVVHKLWGLIRAYILPATSSRHLDVIL